MTEKSWFNSWWGQEVCLLFKESRWNAGSYSASSAVGTRDSFSLG